MFVGERDFLPVRPPGVGNGGQASAARCIADPGGDDAPWEDEHAGLFVQLPDGTLFEALARLETAGRRLPGARGTQEQEHASVLPDRENAGDEIRLQGKPATTVSILPTTRPVYGSRERLAYVGPFANRLVYEAIRRGNQASTSRRLEKWRIGPVSGNSRPICCVIASVRTSASAGWSGHNRWWTSPRRTTPPLSALYRQ